RARPRSRRAHPPAGRAGCLCCRSPGAGSRRWRGCAARSSLLPYGLRREHKSHLAAEDLLAVAEIHVPGHVVVVAVDHALGTECDALAPVGTNCGALDLDLELDGLG